MTTNSQLQKTAQPHIRRIRHRRRLVAASRNMQGRHPALDNFLIREAARAITTPLWILDPPAIEAGGSGYAVGDTFSISSGTFSIQATGRVLTEAGGVVTGIELIDLGAYTVNPGIGVATAAITGVGTGLTVTTVLSAGVVGVTEAELLAAIEGVGTSTLNRNIASTFNIQVAAARFRRARLQHQTYLDAGVPIV